ncbi:aminotransferase class I/II-fold pyridoxal phosphate-dependent enzyme [Oceanobacillus profundus]|uniref:aminotransferase class I/II-fold pyridoxal phosphate-dependent enzyme n=1 Tax=Oceanobacillus profundus TaxID=372463 RepID=UPI001651FACC|nr:aminotransferase class I/II-fold pyridoxal phosphate-dependent enzyme [Oceanobacillus profundus]
MNQVKRHVETKFIHGSQRGETSTGAVNTPIYLSSTFHQNSFDAFGPFDYSRSGNPTRQALEDKIAELENGSHGFGFASGMAAISSVLLLLSAGDHVLVTTDVYGGTYRFVSEVLKRYQIEHTFVNMTDLNETAHAIQTNTKAIYIETPSNPCMNITDLTGIVKIAKANNCLTFVDNTFMTPLYQNPLDLGADIVLHSATKFLSGHSDVIAGLAVTRDESLGEKLASIQNSFGAILGAQDSYLLLQGMKTLGARLKQSSQSAQVLVDYLKAHRFVEKVYYPGLASHPGFTIHQRQSKGSGAVFSFQLPNRAAAKAFVDHVQIPVFAVSLGAVESILSYPTTMSHAAMSKEEREKRGITDGLLRFSAGLEFTDDLIADFDQALHAAEVYAAVKTSAS